MENIGFTPLQKDLPNLNLETEVVEHKEALILLNDLLNLLLNPTEKALLKALKSELESALDFLVIDADFESKKRYNRQAGARATGLLANLDKRIFSKDATQISEELRRIATYITSNSDYEKPA